MPAKVIQLIRKPRVSTRELCRGIVEQYRHKHQPQASAGSLWATTEDRRDGMTMREITPPLMSDQERAQGTSTNSRLHRLISGKK